jgi:hypothetical protein
LALEQIYYPDMDLGRKINSTGGLATVASKPEEPKITYPNFGLSDEVAAKFTDEHDPKLGDEYAATVRLKVTSLTTDEYGKRVSFDVLDLADVAEEQEEGKEDFDESSGSGSGSGAGESEEDALESKVLGYKRKKTAKEAPDMSAEDLQD